MSLSRRQPVEGPRSSREAEKATRRGTSVARFVSIPLRRTPDIPKEVRRVRATRFSVLALTLLLCATPLGATPVDVRLQEGTVRGFLAIRSPAGARLGHGELSQRPRGGEIENHLVLRFDD